MWRDDANYYIKGFGDLEESQKVALLCKPSFLTLYIVIRRAPNVFTIRMTVKKGCNVFMQEIC